MSDMHLIGICPKSSRQVACNYTELPKPGSSQSQKNLYWGQFHGVSQIRYLFCLQTINHYPIVSKYQNQWPVRDMLKLYLKSSSAAHRQAIKALNGNKGKGRSSNWTPLTSVDELISSNWISFNWMSRKGRRSDQIPNVPYKN